MRIGLTLTTIEPMITHGKLDGIGTYTKNLYEQLVQAKQTVIPYSFPNTKSKLSSAFSHGKFFNYSYSLSTVASLINLKHHSIHGKLKSHIDLLHSTDHMIPKIHDVPTIATLNDSLMFMPKYQHYKNIRLSHIKQWMRKQSLRWADVFITISACMRQELIENLSISEDKLAVIHLGISPWWLESVSEFTKQQTLKKLNLPNNFLLFTGTLQYKKNLPRLIDAFLLLPIELQKAYPLVVVGQASFDAAESLIAINKLKSSGTGYWLNYVSIEELRTLFQCATLHVHPSLHEGFGLTLLEAFASKTAVLTSNVTAMPEIAGDAAYLVNPYDTDEIRHGLEYLLTHPSVLSNLVQKGELRVKQFSWKKCAEETIKLYQRLA